MACVLVMCVVCVGCVLYVWCVCGLCVLYVWYVCVWVMCVVCMVCVQVFDLPKDRLLALTQKAATAEVFYSTCS